MLCTARFGSLCVCSKNNLTKNHRSQAPEKDIIQHLHLLTMKLFFPTIALATAACLCTLTPIVQGKAVRRSNDEAAGYKYTPAGAGRSQQQRDLQAPDIELLIEALASGIPAIVDVALAGLLDVLDTLVTDPGSFFEALAEAIANVVTAVVTTVVNIVAATLPELISGVIVNVVSTFDPTDLPTFLAGETALNDTTCMYNYTVTFAQLSKLSSANIGGLSIENPVISDSVLAAGVAGTFSFDELLWTFKGDLTTNNTDDASCEDMSYTAVAKMTDPTIVLDLSFAGELKFNSTTNSDWITITEVDIAKFDLSGSNYDWISNDGPEELEEVLAANIDETIVMAEDATSVPETLLNATGIELPYGIDTTIDIPFFG